MMLATPAAATELDEDAIACVSRVVAHAADIIGYGTERIYRLRALKALLEHAVAAAPGDRDAAWRACYRAIAAMLATPQAVDRKIEAVAYLRAFLRENHDLDA